MKRIFILIIIFTLNVSVTAQLNDLMITEYSPDWKGNTSYVGLKVYNPTMSNINLSQYYVQVYTDGQTTAQTNNQLYGTLAPDSSVVIGRTDANLPVGCQIDIPIPMYYADGNDCVALTRGSTAGASANFVDMINLFGVDVRPMLNSRPDALEHTHIQRHHTNCIRYTSIDGISPNSWLSDPFTNMPGWDAHCRPVCCVPSVDFYNPASPTKFITARICSGQSYTLPDSTEVTSAGVYRVLRANNGFECDSVIETTVEVTPPPIFQTSFAICEGDSIFIGGRWQHHAGLYRDTIEGDPCDSVIETALMVEQRPSVTKFYDLCAIDSTVVIDGKTFDEDTVFTFAEPNPAGCDSLITVEIVGELVSADFIYEHDAKDSGRVYFYSLAQGMERYLWDFGNGDTSAEAVPLSAIEYPSGTYRVTLEVVSAEGCEDTISKSIEIPEPQRLRIPNVFTPNGDGKNDFFKIDIYHTEQFLFSVYNRWGTKLYETTDPAFKWDGKVNGNNCASGTYMYVLKADEVYSGFLTLVR